MYFWSPSREEAPTYEALWRAADPQRRGALPGSAAVPFFSRSGLDRATLSAIWRIADDKHAGQLDRTQFCVACRLIAIAQAGRAVDGRR